MQCLGYFCLAGPGVACKVGDSLCDSEDSNDASGAELPTLLRVRQQASGRRIEVRCGKNFSLAESRVQQPVLALMRPCPQHLASNFTGSRLALRGREIAQRYLRNLDMQVEAIQQRARDARSVLADS